LKGIAEAAWDQTFMNVVEQACERAMQRTFSAISDVEMRQALTQGFAAGVEWCFSPQFDVDVAKATLAVGVSADEAVSGGVRKRG